MILKDNIYCCESFDCSVQAHLKEHLTMHSSDRPFLCQYCGSAFKTQSVQRKHIQSLHLKPRAYNCNVCSKKFNTGYALQRHSRTHETEVPANSQEVLVDLAVTESGHLKVESVSRFACIGINSVLFDLFLILLQSHFCLI